MSTPGTLYGSRIGYDELALASLTAVSTFAMGPLNSGWCARFTAQDTRDIYSVWVNFSAVAAAGTIQVRIETIDTTTGKPTGTLYDANASVNITPSTAGTQNWQQATFASHPTTGLTVGTEYAVVLLTTVAGTTHTLRAYISQTYSASYPTVALTASDGTTRTNFAEVASSVPLCTLGMSDGNDDPMGMAPYDSSAGFDVYGTRAFGLKLVLNAPVIVRGYQSGYVTFSGTPSNLRARLFDSSDAVVSGSTATTQQKSLTGLAAGRRERYFFGAPITLAAGTYRIVFDQTDHTTTSTNRYTFTSPRARVAAVTSSGTYRTDTTDITAVPIVWTDTAAHQPVIGLMLDDLPTPTGGGGAGPFSRIQTGM